MQSVKAYTHILHEGPSIPFFPSKISPPKLNSTVSAPGPDTTPSDSVNHFLGPVFEEVRHISDGVAMGEKIPSASTITVVIEPGTEDEVGGDSEESSRR